MAAIRRSKFDLFALILLTKRWPKQKWKTTCFRYNNTSLPADIVYKNFIFTQEYASAERCCFLTFSFEGKFIKYDISVKRKHTKTNKNAIFSSLFTNFSKTKIPFFMQCNFNIYCACLSCLSYYLLFKFEWSTFIVISSKINNFTISVYSWFIFILLS